MRLVIALAFTAPLFAQTCTYLVSPNRFDITAGQTPGTVHVTQAPGSACGNYSATVDPSYPWLHITSDLGGAPGTDVSFIAESNLSANPRTGVMRIANTNVIVNQAGAVCNFGLSPTTQSFPVGGGTGSASIQAACAWQATASPWIAFNGSNTGTQNATLNYTVAANPCVDTRNGSITLQTGVPPLPTLAITQAGAPGNLTLSPASISAAAAASNGRIALTTGDTCPWTATADVSWIQITVGSSGTGSGGISYRLLDNTSSQRSGNIHVGSLICNITQAAPGPPPASITTVANAANYNTDAVSPGEIVALFGDNMGPASIVTLQVDNGTVINNLSGTQVLFDGVPAPMVYTLKNQISAVVPYGVAGKTSTDVQVKYQGTVSNTLTVPVRAATPAIFSLDSSGKGPGAILNQDLQVNTTGNPAARLSIIVLYCTGGGVTDPVSKDGEVIGPPLRNLAQTPVVTIGGVNATVKFAGAGNGLVAGVNQINVEVPAAVTPGIALPVLVKIGDATSSAGVTVAVK